jgi:predicted nuclease of predicted toxin-antitoxin system
MTLWIDAQLSPYIALWVNENFPELRAQSLRSLNLRDANDYGIFQQARKAGVTLMSKDQDFVKLIELYGTPPKLLWITCGNTSNVRLCEILATSLKEAIALLNNNENIVEISDKAI